MIFSIDPILNIAQQGRVALGTDFGITKLAFGRVFNGSTQLRRHGLHAVANTQYRYAELKHDVGRTRSFVFIHRRGTAGQNDSSRGEIAHESVAHVVGMKLAIDARFAHATGDELGGLRTEVEDQDFLVHGEPGKPGERLIGEAIFDRRHDTHFFDIGRAGVTVFDHELTLVGALDLAQTAV